MRTYEADAGRLLYGRQTTCSRACSYLLRGQQKEQRVIIRCGVCKQKFTRSPSQIKSKHGVVYCSTVCHYAGRTLGLTGRVITKPYIRKAGPPTPEQIARQVASRRAGKGYAHSDDTRARLSEATTSAIAEGRISTISRFENEVAEVLDSLGVRYRRQVAFRGASGRYVACVDFLLDDGRVLEAQGSFWHSDPILYPDGPIFPAQRRSLERWGRKVELMSSLGITILEVWEGAFEKNPLETVTVALATI